MITQVLGRGSPLNVTALGLHRLSAQLYESHSPELRAAGKVLRRTWSRVLSVRGGGRPSAPGEPPRRQTGRLARSVAEGPTSKGRVVAVLRYTGPILEGGVNTALPPRAGRQRRRRAGVARRQLVIQSRPSANRAIELAREEMARVAAELGGNRVQAVLEGRG